MKPFIILFTLFLSIHSWAEGKILRIDGSDTLAPFIRMNIPDWLHHNGGHAISISSNGSSIGLNKLIKGEVELATASRIMSKTEYERFVEAHGQTPFSIKVAIDGISVIVHKSNPMEGIKLSELGRIFSITGGCASETGVEDWSELNLKQNGKINPISRDSQSGTFGYVNKRVLCGERLAQTVSTKHSHRDVIDAVAKDEHSIGFVSMNWQSASVKTLPIWSRVAKRYVYLDEASITYGYYPLARHLIVYGVLQEDGNLPEVSKNLLSVLLSDSGQAKAELLGYTKLSRLTLSKQLQKLKNH